MRVNVSSLLTQGLAVDLGSATTRMALAGRDAVWREPSVVAYREDAEGERRPVAVGTLARAMLGRTSPAIQTARPVRGGIVEDYQAAEEVLRFLLGRVQGRKPLVAPEALITLPAGVTEVERRAARECTERAGIKRLRFIGQPLAAALGAGLPLAAPEGNMIVDVGAGSTQVSVISLGGVVHARRVAGAGEAMDAALIRWMETIHGLCIGPATAEDLKLRLGGAFPGARSGRMAVAGLDRERRLPRRVVVEAAAVAEVLQPVVESIVEAITATLERIPPELVADVAGKGALLIGGGALLPGLDEAIGRRIRLAVFVPEEPLSTVVLGAARALTLADDLGGIFQD
ncbi:MAG: rod shape-determining protein [Pseudomonadota bacterium]